MKTQIYRPVFFDATDHETFTSNPDKYKCTTSKSFVDFLGNTVEMVKDSGGNWTTPQKADPRIRDFNYDSENNMVSYTIQYDPIDVENGSFTFHDIQYFTMADENGSIYRTYYNKHQR